MPVILRRKSLRIPTLKPEADAKGDAEDRHRQLP